MPASSTLSHTVLPRRNREDYPNIKYWRSTEYKTRDREDRSLRPAEDDRISTMYLELPTGQQVSKSLRQRLYNHVSAFWKTLESSGESIKNFTDTNLDILKRFRESVEAEFDFLQLCEHHWKADELWKQVSSTFLKKHAPTVKKEAKSVKIERKPSAVEDDHPTISPVDIDESEPTNFDNSAKQSASPIPPVTPSPKRPASPLPSHAPLAKRHRHSNEQMSPSQITILSSPTKDGPKPAEGQAAQKIKVSERTVRSFILSHDTDEI